MSKYRYTLLASLACLGLGYGIGVRVAKSRVALHSAESGPTEQRPEPERRRLIREEMAHRYPTQTLRPEAPDYVSRVKTLLSLNRMLGQKFTVFLLSGDTVNNDFAKLFGLSPAQVKAINALVKSSKSRVAKMEAENATIVPDGRHGFTISIHPFPTEGGRLYDETLSSLKDILGPERFSLYESMPYDDLESPIFGGFGLESKTITVDPRTTKDGKVNAYSSTGWNAKTMMLTTSARSNPQAFKLFYPELYKKMVNSGQWTYP